MSEDSSGAPLSRRVPGSTRSGPSQPVRQVLSDTDVNRIQAAIHAEQGQAETTASREPNTEPMPRVTDSDPETTQAGTAGGSRGRAASQSRAEKAPLADPPLRAAKALRAAEELRAAEAPRARQRRRSAEPASATGRLRPEEPVVAQDPVGSAGAGQSVRPAEPEQVPDPVSLAGSSGSGQSVRPAEPVQVPDPATLAGSTGAGQPGFPAGWPAADQTFPTDLTFPTGQAAQTGQPLRPAEPVPPAAPLPPVQSLPAAAAASAEGPGSAWPAAPVAPPGSAWPAASVSAGSAPPASVPPGSAPPGSVPPGSVPPGSGWPPVPPAEVPRPPRPPERSWPSASVEPAPGAIGWLWPENTTTPSAGTRWQQPRPWQHAGGGPGPGRWRYRTATIVALAAVLLAGGLFIGLSLHSKPTTAASGGKSVAARPPAKAPTSSAVRAATPQPGTNQGQVTPFPEALDNPALAYNRTLVADWVAHQVSPGSTVACDPEMCHALAQNGFAAALDAPVGMNSLSLSGAQLVAVTPQLRYLFRMHPSVHADVAPVVLARYGSGRSLVTIQPVYAAGGTAYQTALNQDVQQRIQLGQQLLNGGQVTAKAKAQGELLAGEVDPRLLLLIQALARQTSVYILSFSDSGPGASPGVPLRTVDIATTDPSSGESGQMYLHLLRTALSGQGSFPPFAHVGPQTMASGQEAVQVIYDAPTPLGLLASS